MEPSSRIFVKGLPPTFTEAEFRKHFAFQARELTDAKIFPNRRIGYVGYKTPENAMQAVKYFNRSFIRMSKIEVQIARPMQNSKGGNAPTAQRRSRAPSQPADGPAESSAEAKKEFGKPAEDDPKLKEFLEAYKPKSNKRGWEAEGTGANALSVAEQDRPRVEPLDDERSEDEYQEVPRKVKRAKLERSRAANAAEAVVPPPDPSSQQLQTDNSAEQPEHDVQTIRKAVSDADWARSRTSRLLGLLDEDEEKASTVRAPNAVSDESQEEDLPNKRTSGPRGAVGEASLPSPPADTPHNESAKSTEEANEEDVPSMRLFLRNLPYDVTEGDLQAEFARFGNVDEVHVPLDKSTGAGKGFAYLRFSRPESAAQALEEKDGQTFQGRLLHIMPAKAKKATKLDDFALSRLPLKKQQEIKRRREAASSTFNWNTLYMNPDAVVGSVADRLGIAKSEALDPTSSDAAVKQAHAETHIIQETKAYFKQQGVDLDAFKRSQRGDTAILVKNIPYDCSGDELRRLFEEHGELKRFLMPPSGTIAVVEFANAAQCKTAFGALAYRKLKSSVLFLEKAPKALFTAKPSNAADTEANSVSKTSASDLKDAADNNIADTAGTATLFVRNLNFTTTTAQLTQTCSPLTGLLSARVKTKTEPKKPGQILSMGFGFLEFRSLADANAAMKAMDGYVLEGHKLQIRASHKGADVAEIQRKAKAAKHEAGKKTKVIIKNLPFEATKKDVRALFGAYGQLSSVRVPKKMDRAGRGFAFADFASPKEAEVAMDALRDTHLLGRRLVLDFAAEDSVDAEEEIQRMQIKVGGQVNKLALQRLTGGGRKKFTTAQEGDRV